MPAKKTPKKGWAPPPENVIQLKVTLEDTHPPVWRRVVVPDNYTLRLLHDVIQIAMGWENCHLHSFKIGDVSYTCKEGEEMEEMGMECEDNILLRDVISQPKQKFHYEYDFGDSWGHKILVEEILPFQPQGRYPVCLIGVRACPPEDCGGIPGYCEILEALKAPKKNESYSELLEWVGEGYDPEQFDLEAVNRRLKGIR
ncbi:MAG: plasmid pRiA4b ORF-3 family protein [Candidatus Sumerlaeota bacterium]|nr:plasmid pRiA4b ORF-3 family protein [Candidatus Sumerlaeota bacterium]